MSFEGNFLKSVERNSKKYFTRASIETETETEIVKKFGVHSCIFQSTTGDQYQGGLETGQQKKVPFVGEFAS